MFPRWVAIYTMIVAVVISSLICLIVNICIFKFCRSLSRRTQPIGTIVLAGINANIKLKISSRDIRLLKYMIYMFVTFVIGWGPIYTLMIYSHSMLISRFVDGLLCIWAQISLLCLIINMFMYNNSLRTYLLNKMFRDF